MNWWAIAVGSGLALSPIHNDWLTDLATNSRGEVVFFLPSFGFLLLTLGTGFFLMDHWDQVKAAGWGSRYVTIPLLIIVLAISLSGIPQPGIWDKVAPAFAGLALMALYLISRVLGRQMFIPLAIGAVGASVGVLLYRVLSEADGPTGGYLFESNFDILVGYVLLGAALLAGKHQWLLLGFALFALALSGSPEAVLPVTVVAATVIIRRDWSKKAIALLGAVALAFLLILTSDNHEAVYGYTGDVISNTETVNFQYDGANISESPLEWRWRVIRSELGDLEPLGDGYNITKFSTSTVHNVPLIIVQQTGYPGIMAALAWLWVSLYCLLRTRWKYVWLVILALSVFDHYIWTQLGPVWWAVVGASLVGTGSDLIFRREDAHAVEYSCDPGLQRVPDDRSGYPPGTQPR